MKLRFTYRAVGDLQRLRSFIAEDSPLAAQQKIDSLRRSIRLLPDQPRLGREIDQASGLRQWIAGDYVVRYFLDDDVLTIARIWHGKEQRPSS